MYADLGLIWQQETVRNALYLLSDKFLQWSFYYYHHVNNNYFYSYHYHFCYLLLVRYQKACLACKIPHFNNP